MKTYYLLLIAVVIFCGCKDEITNTSDSDKRPWKNIYPEYVTRLITCQNGYIIGVTGRELLKSKDEGDTWLGDTFPYPIQTLCSGINDEIYTASSNNLLLSTNYGGLWDWKPVMFDNETGGVTYPEILCCTVSPDNVLYIGTYMGIMRSEDRGNTWKRLLNGFTNFTIVSVLVAKDGTVFAGTRDEQSILYMSYDKGETWQKTSVTGQPITALAEDPNGTIYAGGLFKLYKSSDNGATWSSDLAPGTKCSSIIFDKNDHIFASFNEGGLFMSTDKGMTWTDRTPDSSAAHMPVYSVAISRDGYLIVSTPNGIYKSKKTEYQ
jgi:photosystem II stability/assembly factor-like uncharacterized protein